MYPNVPVYELTFDADDEDEDLYDDEGEGEDEDEDEDFDAVESLGDLVFYRNNYHRRYRQDQLTARQRRQEAYWRNKGDRNRLDRRAEHLRERLEASQRHDPRYPPPLFL